MPAVTLLSLRTAHGLTQQQVADAAGMPRQDYYRLEKGTRDIRNMRYNTLTRVAKAFGMTTDELIRTLYEAEK